MPPIGKLDNSLVQLVNCRRLALSTNSIERMVPFPFLRNLQILSMGRNQLKRIQGLEEIGQTLKELWLSYNQIEKLEGLQPCIHLETLYIAQNKIRLWDEVSRLAQLPAIRNLLLVGNPVYEDQLIDLRVQVVRRCPQLEVLDTHLISEHTRREAEAAKLDKD